MGSEPPKPVLWVSLTSDGRHTSADSLESIRDTLEDTLGDEYHIVVADDKVRLLDEAEVKDLISGLQDHAAQFAHEDALAEAIEDSQEGDDA